MQKQVRGTQLSRADYAGAMGMFAYASSAIMTPICLLKMMEDLSFSLSGGGGIEAVRTFLMVFVLLLSGFAATHWGKIGVLIYGSFALAAGMFAYAFAPAYSVVLVAMIFVGLGGGIIEGLINPLIQDLHPTDSGKYLNIVNAFWSIGILSTVIVVGELLTRGVSWRLLMACSGGLAVIAALLFLVFRGSVPAAAHRDTTRERSAAKSFRETWAQTKKIIRLRRFWVFAAALGSGGAAEGAFTFWSASYVQIHYGALPRAGGFGTACFAAGMIAGRMLSGHFVQQKHLKNLILFSGLAGIAVSLFVFAIGSIGGFYVCLVFAGLTAACFWPSIQSYAADCLDVDTTMLFILLSSAGIPAFGFSSWLMGIIGDLAGIRASFALVPFFFLALVLIIESDYRVHRYR